MAHSEGAARGGRPGRRLSAASALLLAAALLASCEARGAAVDTADAPALAPSSALVARVQVVSEQGGRLDWSHSGELLAYDRLGESGRYEIYTARPDGSEAACLTCDKEGLPETNRGNPAWHPSGEYILFQAGREDSNAPAVLTTPGMGRANLLWVMRSDGSAFFALTESGTSVLHPQFSPDGARVAWAEQVGGGSLRNIAGAWQIKVADFVVAEGRPSLQRTQSYQPLGPVWYETHSFTPDGRRLLFTAHLQPDESGEAWMDIYALDLASGQAARLTSSPEVWDEHAHVSPGGGQVVWMSSADCGCDPSRLRTLRSDLWLMGADGADPTRLTSFSTAGSPDFIAEDSVVTDSAWSPDGTRVAAVVYSGLGALNERRVTARIVIVELAEAP